MKYYAQNNQSCTNAAPYKITECEIFTKKRKTECEMGEETKVNIELPYEKEDKKK